MEVKNMKIKLYLQGHLSSEDSYICCPFSTGTVLFVLSYCRTDRFQVVIVSGDSNKSSGYACCKQQLNVLSHLDLSFVTWSEVPQIMRNVSLPSTHQPQISLVRSGLCVVLRHIIKASHDAAPHLHLIDLLGFRQGSMRMCSEVSGWTKLCEIELDESVSNLISQLIQTKSSDEKNEKIGLTNLTLPPDLMKLESHFIKKCVVHNENKKKRDDVSYLKKKYLSQIDDRLRTGVPANTSPHSCSEFKNVTTSSSSLNVGLNASNVSELKEEGSTLSDQSCTEDNKLSSNSPMKSTVEKFTVAESHFSLEQTICLHHGIRKLKVEKTIDKKLVSRKDRSLELNQNGKSAVVSKSVQKHTTATVHSVTNSVEVETNLKTEEKDLECASLSLRQESQTGISNFVEPFDVAGLVRKLTYLDIEYVHVYSEGIEMTVTDLILLVYLYYLIEAMDFKCDTLVHHIPSILQWVRHMVTLEQVVFAGQTLGWLMSDLLASLDAGESSSTYLGSQVCFVKNEDAEDEEMELSRCARMKYKASQTEVMQTLNKFEVAAVKPLTGTHPCGDMVEVDWESLPPGVHPGEGDVPLKRTQRKCQQLENLVTAAQAVAKPGDIIVDFCSGGGHLGIVVAYLLPECQIYLVENKEESLLKACSRLESLKLCNVTLFQCNLDYFVGHFQVGMSLHACGSATDMVLQLCLDSQAAFVICPCCYGSIQKTHLLSYPRSEMFMHTNITYKDFLTLGHAADQTEFNIALEDQGRLCMNLVDSDRSAYAKQKGYSVCLCSLKPLSCTPKNNLLVGTLN